MLPGGGGAEGDEEWRPQNITRKFYGPTPMREGLVRSRNLVSIRLLRGAGIGFATRHMSAFGFGPAALPANLTLALGTGQVTPLDMARGYAVFANGGARVTPYFIHEVRDPAGKAIFTATPALACPACGFEPAAAVESSDPAPAAAASAEPGQGVTPVASGTGLVPPDRRRRRRSVRPTPS